MAEKEQMSGNSQSLEDSSRGNCLGNKSLKEKEPFSGGGGQGFRPMLLLIAEVQQSKNKNLP